jgi:hypothetical protein
MPINGLSIANQNGKISLSGLCILLLIMCRSLGEEEQSCCVYTVSSSLRQCFQLFYEARLVIVTNWGFAIWLDPFGMLNPQVIVNPLQKFGVSVVLRPDSNRLSWSVHQCSPVLA